MSLAADFADSPTEAPHRSRLIAALLSLIAPGAGHLYLGRVRRGVALFALTAAVQVAGLAIAFLLPPSFAAICGFAAAIAVSVATLWILVIVDAVRLTRRETGGTPRWLVVAAGVVAAYAVGFGLAAAVQAAKPALPWRTFNAASNSMAPTLRSGETFLADTAYFKRQAPARGDVVVYRLPSDPAIVYVKRVVALAGDQIVFRAGRAVVNGTPVAESYADIGDPKAFFNTTREFTVPDGHVFVTGDNRANSLDSRSDRHGPVPLANLVGRATQILMADDDERIAVWVGSPGGK